MIKKEKFLFGLLYKKTNLLTSEWELRILGFKIFYSKSDILKYKEIVYLNLFKMRLFSKFIRKRISKNYMEYVYNKYPNYDNYIVFSSGFGEIYHTFFYLNQIIKNQCKSGKNLIVFHRYSLQDLYNLFQLKTESVVVESIEGILLDKMQVYRTSNFICLLNFDYFGRVEKEILKNKIHYYRFLKMNILKDINLENSSLPVVSNKICEVFKKSLTNKYIILLPEASTLNFINPDFWIKLINKLQLAGYKILVNSSNPCFLSNGVISSFNTSLSIMEMLELAKGASAIIGLRSGFLEILAEYCPRQIFVLYEDFNQFAQNPLSAEDVITGFTLKQLPFINKSLVHEYNFKDNKTNYSKIINSIVYKIVGLDTIVV